MIEFERPGMQLTLNGIAQGFITDHISTRLKDAGYQHVLVELGETRAIGALALKVRSNPASSAKWSSSRIKHLPPVAATALIFQPMANTII